MAGFLGADFISTVPANTDLASDGASQIRDIKARLKTFNGVMFDLETGLLKPASIAAGMLSANSVVAGNIAPGGVVAGNIAPGAIVPGSLGAGSVTDVELSTTGVIPGTYGVVTVNAQGRVTFGSGGASNLDISVLTEVQPVGTPGSAVLPSVWAARDVNTIAADPTSHVVSLATKQFVLDAGTYYVTGISSAQEQVESQTRLYNVTGAATLLLGKSGFEGPGAIQGIFTVAAAQTLEYQMWARYGYSAPPVALQVTGNELYLQLTFFKIA